MKLFENELINKIGIIVTWTLIVLASLIFLRLAFTTYIRTVTVAEVYLLLKKHEVVNLENQHGIISLVPDHKLIIINLEDRYDEFVTYLEGDHDESND